jgi:hypothetical protein
MFGGLRFLRLTLQSFFGKVHCDEIR